MALSINLLANRNLNPDAELLGTLNQDAVLPFNIFMWYVVSTKAITYGMALTKLSNNTQPNTTSFKNCSITIEEGLDQKASVDVISTLVYIIPVSKAPVNYGDVDQNKIMLEHCKNIVKLLGEAYHQEKLV